MQRRLPGDHRLIPSALLALVVIVRGAEASASEPGAAPSDEPAAASPAAPVAGSATDQAAESSDGPALAAAPEPATEPAEEQAPAPVRLTLSAELYTAFRWADEVPDGAVQSAFDVERAELGARVAIPQGASFEFMLEALRPPGSAVEALGSDPLLLRAKRAQAIWNREIGAVGVELRMGLTHEIWTREVRPRFAQRALGSMVAQSGSMFDSSDLGVTGRLTLLESRLAIAAAVTNDQFRNRSEQNDGKTVAAVVTGYPVRTRVHRGPLSLALHAGIRHGELGSDGEISTRIAAGATFVGPCPQAGFEIHRADNWRGGDDTALAWSAWASSWLGTHWAGLSLRWDALDADRDVEGGVSNRITAAFYTDLIDERNFTDGRRARLWIGYQADRTGDDATALRGVDASIDANRFFVVAEIRGAWSSD